MQPLPRPNRGAPSEGNGAHDQQQNESRPPMPAQHSTSTVRDLTRASTSTNPNPEAKKKRRHRGGKRKKNRRQSFAAPSETSALDGPFESLVQVPENDDDYHNTTGFYGSSPGRRRPTIGNANMSDESMDSEALLDHRDQPSMRPRRDSRLLPSMFSTSQRSPSQGQSQTHPPLTRKRHRSTQATQSDGDDDYDAEEATDRTPLITGAAQHKSPTSDRGYGLYRQGSNNSNMSLTSNHNRRRGQTLGSSFPQYGEEGHDVNNPPSHPPSPSLDAHPDDVMVANGDFLTRSPSQRRMAHARDALVDIDGDGLDAEVNSAPPSPRLQPGGNHRNRHMGHGDVCFPGEEMSEMADDDEHLSRTTTAASRGNRRARRQREWPQLWAFDEWSREEKEYRDGERRAKKINEPMLVQGRLRPTKPAWHRNEEDAPFRYTYFNEEFESTIHAQTISELVQPGASFRELFIPDPPELSDSSESEEEDEQTLEMSEQVGRKENAAGLLSPRSPFGQPHENKAARFESTLSDGVKNGASGSREHSGKSSGQATPQMHAPKAKKYGPRPTFWLDVQSPTDQEMRVLCKAFGIHALTSEDIMMQEAREKVELFRNYYFINYRTFEQDPNSEEYLEPVNMYVCVFRYGIVTFHFSQIPHPANVRRRIRQLTDYLILSADWISYAIIDDITDVYQPLIHNIESEVDDIDDLILKALQETNELKDASSNKPLVGDNKSAVSEASSISGIDMLRRIGECRKKVMTLYRLLGQKADVIKGFAKRCNEQWDVAPKSEIGLYLGDIQDHIVTMSSNLHHYETLLGRAHSNYLAQVSIRMNERQELTADVLGKLTVLGTIVLPLNVICGMWGMNVKVPGQDIDNLYWFWAITAGMVLFAITCFYWCKKVYKVV